MTSQELDQLAINTIRTLSIDAVQQAKSGHPGTPMALAPLAYVLWLRHLKYNPANPEWRDRDRFAGAVIDASGTLPDGTSINGPDDLRKALLRRPEQFVQTFTQGLLSYATGRTLEYKDMPTVRQIVRGAAASDYRLSAIVQAVIKSDQFRMRRAPKPAPAGEKVAAVASH